MYYMKLEGFQLPKVSLSEKEKLKLEADSRWTFAMNMAQIGWKQMSKIMGVCETTYFNRHKDIGKMTLDEIWAIERATGCKLTIPFQRNEE